MNKAREKPDEQQRHVHSRGSEKRFIHKLSFVKTSPRVYYST